MNAPNAIRSSSVEPSDVPVLAPSLHRRRLQCYLGLILTDIAAILTGFALVGYVHLGPTGAGIVTRQAQLVLPLFLTVALYNNAYSRRALHDHWYGIWRAVTAFAVASFAVVLIAFLAKLSEDFSRVSLVGGALAAMALLMWTRLQMRSFIFWRCGRSVVNELIIDDGGPRIDLPNAIRVSARELKLEPDLNNPHSLNRVGMVLRNMDRVVVSCPAERRPAWALTLKGANIEGEVLDDQVVILGAQGARVIGDHGLLLVSSGPLGMRSRVLKRIFDLAIAGFAVIALSPLLLVIALAIKLEDGGPVLFIQRRMGIGNRFFDMYKFRSMSVAQSDPDGTVSTARQDKRITRVGRFIRRTSIDELPQLFNVLKGDMSLVGSRPHAIGSQAGDKLFWEIDHRYWLRHSLKPGLSGLAQVRGYRGATEREADLIERLQADLEYLDGWTLLKDIRILWMTLGVLVHDRAY
ncbi:MAG: sugar transferase [Novosphingobium sp.]|nr:sugar transferase [Novosphingobium sp.]